VVSAGLGLVGPYFACLPRAGENCVDLDEARLPELRSLSFSETFTLWALVDGLASWLILSTRCCRIQIDGLLFITQHFLIVIVPMLLWTCSIIARWRVAHRAKSFSASRFLNASCHLEEALAQKHGMVDKKMENCNVRIVQGSLNVHNFLYVTDTFPILFVLWFHWKFMARLVAVMGWPVILLGPGFGWILPICSILLFQGYYSVEVS
jgi:hypothetical protein